MQKNFKHDLHNDYALASEKINVKKQNVVKIMQENQKEKSRVFEG